MMAFGRGKYDDVCTTVRERTDAKFVAVIIMGGNEGDGFSCQVVDARLLRALPDLLDDLARQVRGDVESVSKEGA